MTISLQIIMILLAFSSLIYIVFNIRKSNMDVHYSIVWILISIFLILISIFPNILNYISRILHIETMVYTLFLLVIIFLFAINFYLFMKVSEHKKNIRNLTYEVSRLDKELRDYIEKNNE